MPTIRDLVGAIRQRAGVEGAIVLGRDGLLIDSQTTFQLDAERIAAHVPSIVSAADELGMASSRGGLMTAVLEHEGGLAVISALTPDAMLVVLVRADANVGPLLLELRRNRQHIASLV